MGPYRVTRIHHGFGEVVATAFLIASRSTVGGPDALNFMQS